MFSAIFLFMCSLLVFLGGGWFTNRLLLEPFPALWIFLNGIIVAMVILYIVHKIRGCKGFNPVTWMPEAMHLPEVSLAFGIAIGIWLKPGAAFLILGVVISLFLRIAGSVGQSDSIDLDKINSTTSRRRRQ